MLGASGSEGPAGGRCLGAKKGLRQTWGDVGQPPTDLRCLSGSSILSLAFAAGQGLSLPHFLPGKARDIPGPVKDQVQGQD